MCLADQSAKQAGIRAGSGRGLRETEDSTGSVANPFGYAGEYTDSETGFVYLRARYYDPATQQFLTVDPALAATQQAYAYAADSPLNGRDPTGRFAWIIAGALGGALGGFASYAINNYAQHGNFNSFDWGDAAKSTVAGTAIGVGLGLFGAGAEAVWSLVGARALAAASGSTVILGRFPEYLEHEGEEGYSVLNVQPSWLGTWDLNRRWVQDVATRGLPVQLASPTTWENMWDAGASRLTVFARELEILESSGYCQVGDRMLPP